MFRSLAQSALAGRCALSALYGRTARQTLPLLQTPLRGMGDEDTDDFLNMASAPEGKSVRAQFFDDDTDDVSNFARGAGGGPGTA